MAILYGTTSGGDLVPVQVDQTGRLVAEGLDGPQGPQGPAGPNELLPYGPEGSSLMIKNGVPAWEIVQPSPGPGPDALTLMDDRDLTPPGTQNYGLWEPTETPYVTSDPWDVAIRTLSGWDTGAKNLKGLGALKENTGNQDILNVPFRLDLSGGESKILQIYCSCQLEQSDPPTGESTFSITTDETQLTPINTSFTTNVANYKDKHIFSFLVRRPDLGITNFTMTGTVTNSTIKKAWFCAMQRFEYVDAASYLLSSMAANS